jgi:hypothetical protein
MMRVATAAAGLAAILALAGCEQAHVYVTWETGLHVHGTATEVETEVAYAELEGSGVEESTGTILTGSLDVLGKKKGTHKATRTTTRDESWQIVGQTTSENPLVPGRDGFGEVPVAVVEGVTIENGTQKVEDETVEELNGKLHSYKVEQFSNIDRATTASTWGLAGDEYVVKIESLPLLWDNDLDDQADPLAGVVHLVRGNVAPGDFWVDPSGATLYKAVGTEPVTVGAKVLDAVKVEMRETGNLDEKAVVSRCLTTPTDKDVSYTTSGDNYVPGYDHDNSAVTVRLDPGCGGAFLHHKTGWQLWYNNVLVKEDATYYVVKISNYGFTWFQGNSIQQAKALPDTGDPRLFAEYTLTTKQRTFQADLWEVVATPWSLQ